MDEARSLAAMLRGSIELTEVGGALRAFNDDMRDRRVLRAEDRPRQKFPVRRVGPLGLFMFPVILGIAMLPG